MLWYMLIFLYNVVTRPFCNTSDAAEQKDFLHFIPHSLHSCEKLTQKPKELPAVQIDHHPEI